MAKNPDVVRRVRAMVSDPLLRQLNNLKGKPSYLLTAKERALLKEHADKLNPTLTTKNDKWKNPKPLQSTRKHKIKRNNDDAYWQERQPSKLEVEAVMPRPVQSVHAEEERKAWLAENKVSVTQRQSQSGFRRDVIEAYQGQCAVTGCEVISILEAAHIYEWKDSKLDTVKNGILLRIDIHRLFDRNILKISRDFIVEIDPSIPDYGQLDGRKLRLPQHVDLRPSSEYIVKRYS